MFNTLTAVVLPLATLTVKIQVKLLEGSWANKVVRHLTPGHTRSGESEVTNQAPYNELYRVRMSRKLGTKRIDYTVRLTRKYYCA